MSAQRAFEICNCAKNSVVVQQDEAQRNADRTLTHKNVGDKNHTVQAELTVSSHRSQGEEVSYFRFLIEMQRYWHSGAEAGDGAHWEALPGSPENALVRPNPVQFARCESRYSAQYPPHHSSLWWSPHTKTLILSQTTRTRRLGRVHVRQRSRLAYLETFTVVDVLLRSTSQILVSLIRNLIQLTNHQHSSRHRQVRRFFRRRVYY